RLQQEIEPFLDAAVGVEDHAADDRPMTIIAGGGEMPTATNLVAAGNFLRRSGLEERGEDRRILLALVDEALRFERQEAEEVLVLEKKRHAPAGRAAISCDFRDAIDLRHPIGLVAAEHLRP